MQQAGGYRSDSRHLSQWLVAYNKGFLLCIWFLLWYSTRNQHVVRLSMYAWCWLKCIHRCDIHWLFMNIWTIRLVDFKQCTVSQKLPRHSMGPELVASSRKHPRGLFPKLPKAMYIFKKCEQAPPYFTVNFRTTWYQAEWYKKTATAMEVRLHWNKNVEPLRH